MEEREYSKVNFSLISSDFKQILKFHNDSSFDQFEFRSLEPSTLKLNTTLHSVIEENSYSDAIQAFVQKIQDRVKSRDDTRKKSKLTSSTPFKKSELRKGFNISGIVHLDTTNQKKSDFIHNRAGLSFNDSDFESMDQDQYDDDMRKNVNSNIVNVDLNISANEAIKYVQLDSESKDKKFIGSIEKFKRNSCLNKTGKKGNKTSKLIKVTREISQAYLKCENQSLACIITTESIREIENYSVSEFAFTHPNKTQSFEASIKNLAQLAVSIKNS
jgi:hypothetical protein